MYVITLGFDENDDPVAKTLVDPPLSEENTVLELRTRVSELLKKPSEDFNLMYCGEILSDESATLKSTNIRSLSSTVHVIPKPKAQQESSSLERWKDPENNHELIRKFVVSFTHMVHCNLLEMASHRLKKRENLDDLIATCPDLSQDPLALCMLSHPDILSQCLLNPEVALKISAEHPALLEACQNLAVAAHEEKLRSRPENDRTIEDLLGSEDGEDDEGQADEPNPPAALRNNLATFITPEQLANALLQAQQRPQLQGIGSASAVSHEYQNETSIHGSTAASQSQRAPAGIVSSPNADSLFAQRSPYSQLPPLGPGPSRPPSIFNQTPIFGQLPYPSTSRTAGSGSSGITQAQLSAALASTFASGLGSSVTNRQVTQAPSLSQPSSQGLSLAQVLAEALAQSLESVPSTSRTEEAQPMDLTNSTDQPSTTSPENDTQPNPEENPE